MFEACVYDHVEISFDSFSWKYCGHNIPGPFVSSGTSMTVRFHSDKLGAETGFLAKWEETKGNNFNPKRDGCLIGRCLVHLLHLYLTMFLT